MKKWKTLSVVGAVLLFSVFLVGYNIYENMQVKYLKHKAEGYSVHLSIYHDRHGEYPKTLRKIDIIERIETKDSSDFAVTRRLGVTRTIRYDRKTPQEYEITISDGGGISVFNSKEKRWKWID